MEIKLINIFNAINCSGLHLNSTNDYNLNYTYLNILNIYIPRSYSLGYIYYLLIKNIL